MNACPLQLRPRSKLPAIAAAVLFASLSAAGCAHLAGDRDADNEDAGNEQFERLMNDAPESLKRKTAASRTAGDALDEQNVVADVRTDAKRDEFAGGNDRLDVPAASPSRAPSTPAPARSRPPGTRKAATNSSVDEIPDAADIGL
jgi:hypothetical protein